jgi:hypothetical protein
MKRLNWAVAAAFVLSLMLGVSPVLADDPQPGTLPESSYTGIISGGGGKPAKPGGRKDKAELSNPAPAGFGAQEAAPTLNFYGWTNLMRLGNVGVNASSWGCVKANEVCSQGWSSTDQNIYYIQSGNYLCRNGSCTSYTYYGVYWWHWAWAGWRWRSNSWTWWATVSQHYFNYGNGSFTRYTSISQIF